MKKIKVFLGAYINQSNAQNLNCLTLAKYIDKDKFDVYTLAIRHGNFGKLNISGVNIFTCNYPVKLTQYFGFLWGIWKSDVAYLPRGNSFKYQQFLLKLFKKKSFKTVENVIDDEALSTALSIFNSIDEVLACYNFVDRSYSITNYMKEYNSEKHQLKTSENILPLATDTVLFYSVCEEKVALKSLIYLGNDMKRKRVTDFVYLASQFPDLKFHIIGIDRNGLVEKNVKKYNVTNVIYHGSLSHSKMLDIVKECDLHILPSKSEGFPRGIIELSAAGIPCITYTGYGADEWINDFENGVVCEDIEAIKKSIIKFKEDNILLLKNSKGAIKLAETYSALNVTKLYEKEIIDLYEV